MVWSLLWKSVKSVDALLAQIFPCFVMPNSAFLIDIIKNLARGCQEAGCSEVNVAVVQTLSATYEILGRFSPSPPPRTGRALARYRPVGGGVGETNTHQLPRWPWCGSWMEKALNAAY